MLHRACCEGSAAARGVSGGPPPGVLDLPATPSRCVRLGCALGLSLVSMRFLSIHQYFEAGGSVGGWPMLVGLACAAAALAAMAALSSQLPRAGAAMPAARAGAAAALLACGAVWGLLGPGAGGAFWLQSLACALSWTAEAFALLCCITALSTVGPGPRVAAASAASAAAVALHGAEQALVVALPSGIWPLAVVSGLLALALPLRESDAVFQAGAATGEAPADVQMTQPAAFLPLKHRLFATLLVFGFPAGLSFFFAVDSVYVSSTPLGAVPLALLAVLGVALRRRISLDALFGLAFVAATGAFLSIGFVHGSSMVVSSALFGATEACLYVLMAALLASIARRNAQGALVSTSWGLSLFMLGWGVAAFVFDHFAHIYIADVPLLLFPAAWAVVVFGAWAMRRFDVDDAVASIEQVVPVAAREREGAGAAGIDAGTAAGAAGAGASATAAPGSAETLAAEAGLTEREREVFELLARGRNASYLQESLHISRNTAKTHIARIYAKLGVHSQQELIDLVEGGR